MDIKEFPKLLSLASFPMGLGGCRSDRTSFDCCEYNITVMDGKTGQSISEVSGNLVKIHHCSLNENNAAVLNQLQNLTIINDEQWRLRMLVSEIKEKKEKIMLSYAKSCLVDAGIFSNKTKDSVKEKDLFAGVWIKCASYFLADAISCLNFKRPSPVHMLESLRNMKKNVINQNLSLIHRMLGIERASTSLLSRMAKSTIGFSDIVENNGHSKIIQKKVDYLLENSLLSDCYFYLGYVNRDNIIKIKNKIHHNPEFIHILKVGLDIEHDPFVLDKQASELLQATNEVLADLKHT
ncbi:MAG: hypothetical protein ABI340_04010 [Nitrososphaera sp.]|jgi:hypothetical protein